MLVKSDGKVTKFIKLYLSFYNYDIISAMNSNLYEIYSIKNM